MNVIDLDESGLVERFDSYIKTCARNEARTIRNARSRIAKYESPFSDFPDEVIECISSSLYDIRISHELKAMEHRVEILDDDLFAALHNLAEDKRTIILLYYYLGMND